TRPERGHARPASNLEPDLAGDDVLEHHPVAGERIERMLERGRPVLLEEEVPHPCEGIAARQRGQQPPGVALDDGGRNACQRTATADEMQPPRRAVAVFAEVERIELAETGEAAHGVLPSVSRRAVAA